MPSLSVYKETKFISQDKVNNTNTTPLVIWTNYGKKQEKLYNTVSASFLGTYVFELAGMNPPYSSISWRLLGMSYLDIALGLK